MANSGYSIGIDPGKVSGFAICHKSKIIYSSVENVGDFISNAISSNKLFQMIEQENFLPVSLIAIENQYFAKNPKTAILLGKNVGCWLGCLLSNIFLAKKQENFPLIREVETTKIDKFFSIPRLKRDDRKLYIYQRIPKQFFPDNLTKWKGITNHETTDVIEAAMIALWGEQQLASSE